MDLIEIVKGMSNAGEAINENFKKLGFDYGQNEKGGWLRHIESGWQIAYQSRLYLITSQTNFDNPIVDFDEVYAVDMTVNGDQSYNSFYDVNDIEVAYKSSSNQLVMRHISGNYRSTDNFELMLIIIGKSK